MSRPWSPVLFAVVFAACSGSEGSAPGPTDASGDNTLADAAHACASAADCDDTFGCTIDSCYAGKCSHTIGPMTGATACPPGEYCTLMKGCVRGKACAKDGDCTSDEPCLTNGRCDPVSSVCVFQTLDKDRDGHPPPVCGGDDCNDGDPSVYPGALELCDGKDNDCDGVVDNGATCPSLSECNAGKCSCKPENYCSATDLCTDKLTDPWNCSACGKKCADSGICDKGVCACPTKAPSLCASACVDLATDPKNCGACGKACKSDQTCVAGSCACGSGFLICGGTCIDPKIDPANCAGCGKACGAWEGCVASTCVCVTGYTRCAGVCTNTNTDVKNCGGCGTSCASTTPEGCAPSCSFGSCSFTCPMVDSGFPDFGTDTGSDGGVEAGACSLDSDCTAPYDCCATSKICGVKIGPTCITT